MLQWSRDAIWPVCPYTWEAKWRGEWVREILGKRTLREKKVTINTKQILRRARMPPTQSTKRRRPFHEPPWRRGSCSNSSMSSILTAPTPFLPTKSWRSQALKLSDPILVMHKKPAPSLCLTQRKLHARSSIPLNYSPVPPPHVMGITPTRSSYDSWKESPNVHDLVASIDEQITIERKQRTREWIITRL